MHPKNNTAKLCECGCGQPTPIATKTRTMLGHVKGQPVRFIRGHSGKIAKPNRKTPDFVELRPPAINGDGTASLPLPGGDIAVIDESDIEAASGYNWYLSDSGRGKRYVRSRKSRTNSPIYLHRLILPGADGRHVDHVNGDTLDNRRENLRVASHTENTRNSSVPRNNTSGFKGVSKATWVTGRWRATIRIDGKQAFLGVFDTPEEAAIAYDEAAKNHYGEFAHLNFPD